MKPLLLLLILSMDALASYAPVPSPPTDIYVATTGSNASGTGLIGAPYATVTFALAKLPKYPQGCLQVPYTIHVADGAYSEAIDIETYCSTFGTLLTITGNTTTPANVTFTGTVTRVVPGIYLTASLTYNSFVTGPVNVVLQGITLAATSDVGVMSYDGSTVTLDRSNVSTGTKATAIEVIRGKLNLTGNISLTGWTQYAVDYGNGSSVFVTGAGTITVTGPASPGSTVWGFHGYHNSHFVVLVNSVTITESNVFYGAQTALSSTWQFWGVTGTWNVSNGSTPSSSAIFDGTDHGDASVGNGVTTNASHFTNSINNGSISYAEIGTRSFTSVGATVCTDNSICNLF